MSKEQEIMQQQFPEHAHEIAEKNLEPMVEDVELPCGHIVKNCLVLWMRVNGCMKRLVYEINSKMAYCL